MDPATVLAWARGIERLAIVGLSGLSLVLGWDLFRRGVVIAQNGDLQGHGWRVRLQRVGPGIFFALFATAAFISAISHPLEITTGKKSEQASAVGGSPVSTTTQDTQTVVDAANPAISSDRDVIAAINTFHLIALPHASPSLDASNIAAVNKADQTLDSYKKSLMFQRFGQMSVQFYSIRDKVVLDQTLLGKQPADFQNQYLVIEGWDKDTFLRSR